MPPYWWAKSSSKDAKEKSNKGSFIDTIQKKLRHVSKGKCKSRSGGSLKQQCATPSPTSPSTQVPLCQSSAEGPQAQPLPLPGFQRTMIQRADYGNRGTEKPEVTKGSKQVLAMPLSEPGGPLNGPDPIEAGAAVRTAALFGDKSTDNDNPSDSHLPSSKASYYYKDITAMNSPSSSKEKKQLPITDQNNSKEELKSTCTTLNSQVPTSSKQGCISTHVSNLQINHNGAFYSVSNSTSPRSPLRVSGPEPVMNSGIWAGRPCDLPFLGSGHCSNPGSGSNSGQNAFGGDMIRQLFWQFPRHSPECSATPSPRMTKPEPGSIIPSGAVTHLHPQAGVATEPAAQWPDDITRQCHRLPRPPITTSSTSTFFPSCSTGTTSVTQSLGSAEAPTSPGSYWKKGKLIGQGTFGHVYLGFNSENGIMCAMKEVTLFSDDAKSKESAEQLRQEVALLSRLQHPHIVQYFGSEMIDEKLYIYLEYVAGGSINTILREYGQLSEAVIRSYTKQILSGLKYLHARNTVHRDIKGANILVGPNGIVKLADFGMAKHIDGPSCKLSLKGTCYWMAPEIIKNSNDCNQAVDIWSLGCTVLEMATTEPPWCQYELPAAMYKIGFSKALPDIPDHLSSDCKDLILRCLQRDPATRPSAAQLLQHPFVKYAPPPKRYIPSHEHSAVRPSADGYGHGRQWRI